MLRLRTHRILALLIVLPAIFGMNWAGKGEAAPLPASIGLAISPTTATVQTGGTQQFTASIAGKTTTAVTWSVNNIPGGNTTVGRISTAGLYTAPLAVPSPNVVTVTATSFFDPTNTASATVTITAPPITVTISPLSATVQTGATRQFTATVKGTTNKAVTWSVDDVVGGNATVGTISTGGLYTAPAVVPSPNQVTVKATSAADPAKSASATVTITLPPITVKVSPTSATVQTGATRQFTATVTGTTNTAVTWSVNNLVGGNATVGTISTGGLYTAPATAPSPNRVTVKATSAADPAKSASARVTITAPIAVAISPTSATVQIGATRQFIATVTGTTNTAVIWSVNNIVGGNPTVGMISTAGLYTAPRMLPSPNPVTVKATSAADATKSASAAVTISSPYIAVAISPTSATLQTGAMRQFTATVTGTTNTAVTWSVNDIVGGNATLGTISTAGLYTAATMVPSPNQVTVKATSVADPSKSASATVTITATIMVTILPASATLSTGAAQQFTATVTGTTNTAVTWSVNDIVGGNATVGTISAAGLYTAPAAVPSPNQVTVKATSVADPTKSASAMVTVANPTPVLYSVSPTGVDAGASDTLLTVSGSGFVAQSVVYADTTPLGTTLISSTELRATLPSAMLGASGTLTITVVTPAPGGGTSTGISLRIWPTYPRPGAGSVLRTPPALKPIPVNGTAFSVLDWTSKDNIGNQDDLLAASHSVAPMGIPHVETTDLATATTRPFLAVAGVLNTASSLSSSERSGLITYVENGGTLYLWRPSVTALLTDLGIGTTYSHTGDPVRPLTFDVAQIDPLLGYIDHPLEINWQPSFPSADLTLGYDPGACVPLAWWGTGDAAVLRCDMGTGRAYVFGWRLRPLLTLAERQLGQEIEPPNTNALVLDADICRLLMRGSYEGYAANPQVRQFAPEGRHAALIITHDVDARVAYAFVPEYADVEASLGFKSTFLYTTNPYDTGYLGPMYVAAGMESIQYALGLGFDVGSHSFGHFHDFNLAPYGTGAETASNYLPMYSSETGSTTGMTVVGELGVSRWLLENDFGITIDGYRSGYLYIPNSFLQGLAETGYQRDTTYALGLTRGSFPFAAFTVSSGVVTNYPVMEYPVALSDEEIDASTYTEYLDAWETVIRANYANNAPTILLLHPVDNTIRIQALQEIIQRVSDLDLWIGDWKTFAEFWAAQGVIRSVSP